MRPLSTTCVAATYKGTLGATCPRTIDVALAQVAIFLRVTAICPPMRVQVRRPGGSDLTWPGVRAAVSEGSLENGVRCMEFSTASTYVARVKKSSKVRMISPMTCLRWCFALSTVWPQPDSAWIEAAGGLKWNCTALGDGNLRYERVLFLKKFLQGLRNAASAPTELVLHSEWRWVGRPPHDVYLVKGTYINTLEVRSVTNSRFMTFVVTHTKIHK